MHRCSPIPRRTHRWRAAADGTTIRSARSCGHAGCTETRSVTTMATGVRWEPCWLARTAASVVSGWQDTITPGCSRVTMSVTGRSASRRAVRRSSRMTGREPVAR